MLLLRYAAHIFFKEVADLGADLFLVEHLPRQIIGIFPQVNLCEIDAHEFVHIDARRDNSASSGMITSTKTELQIPQ